MATSEIKAPSFELVFENCEVAQITSYATSVYLDGIKQHFWNGKLYEGVEHVAITISKDTGGRHMLGDDDGDFWKRVTRCNDITHIEINGHYYSVPWSDEDEYENEYQYVKDRPNSIEIIISPTRKSLDDF